ncbi:MAG: hypothetical protein JST28_23375 [Acidobacteria bacterium]|nr:hypothetical protein [Acidobacteriota bacterium]
MGSSLVFEMEAFDSLIRVECDNAELRDTLLRYLLPPLPRREASSVAPDIDIQIKQSADSFVIRVNGEAVSSAVSLSDAALETVKAVDEALVQRFKTLRAVHAGAVVIQQKALIIPGTSHAGKTALTAEFLRRGATHLSDEYALIDAQGRVHAYPRPLLLRNGSPKQSLVLPEELNSSFVASPVPGGWVFALEYSPDAKLEISKRSQSETVMLLLRNTPHEMEKSPQMVDAFLRLAAGAECYEGKRGEAGETVDRVLSLIGQK